MLAALCFTRASLSAAETPSLSTEHFDRDPGWEGRNNHVEPAKALLVKQDFGYNRTDFAGAAPGELGGRIQRSTTPASYAAPLAPAKTLDEPFSASGTFAILAPGGGFFFGFFQAQQPGASGRPIGSLGLNFDFERTGGRLAVRLITSRNRSCGTFVTPYLPGRFRPTPIRCDGTRYRWTLNYDPQGASGNGRFTFEMHSDTHTTQDYGPLNGASQTEALARFPSTTTFTVDLPAGYKAEGAAFDRFGIVNMMKAGGAATVAFDDLKFAGQTEDFTKDPGWVGVGNRRTYEDRELTGAHRFGFSAATAHAGGAPGEVGGDFWRSGRAAYYAARVGELGLDQRLEARGKVKLVSAGPDSDMSFGWFSHATADDEDPDLRNFVGIHVGGPTRIGHYFMPRLATSAGTKGKVESGPILTPGENFDWSLVYDPLANHGNGEIVVKLGDQSATLALKPGLRKQGAKLDRFGMFTSTIGGQMVRIFFDDLEFTAARANP